MAKPVEYVGDHVPVFRDGTTGLPQPLRVLNMADDLVARAESHADRVYTVAENSVERLLALALLDLCAELRRLRDE